MNKKIVFLASIFGCIFFSINAEAIQMNIRLAQNIVDNKDRLNVSYSLYYPDSSVSQEIKTITQQVFQLWLAAFNRENKDLTPIDFKGKLSEISLGYNKNSQDFYPSSCQNICLTGIRVINILQSETGCVVK